MCDNHYSSSYIDIITAAVFYINDKVYNNFKNLKSNLAKMDSSNPLIDLELMCKINSC